MLNQHLEVVQWTVAANKAEQLFTLKNKINLSEQCMLMMTEFFLWRIKTSLQHPKRHRCITVEVHKSSDAIMNVNTEHYNKAHTTGNTQEREGQTRIY